MDKKTVLLINGAVITEDPHEENESGHRLHTLKN